MAEKNNKFKAIDKAIGKNGFRVVTLLRLSPLLPLALSNYFYGLTSVDLSSYVAGSWLGMLPGTVLYVIAGEGSSFSSSNLHSSIENGVIAELAWLFKEYIIWRLLLHWPGFFVLFCDSRLICHHARSNTLMVMNQ